MDSKDKGVKRPLPHENHGDDQKEGVLHDVKVRRMGDSSEGKISTLDVRRAPSPSTDMTVQQVSETMSNIQKYYATKRSLSHENLGGGQEGVQHVKVRRLGDFRESKINREDNIRGTDTSSIETDEQDMSTISDEIDIGEQFRLQNLLLEDIQVQATQLMQLEQYCGDSGPMCSLPCATTTVENDAVKKHQGFEQLSHLGLTSKRLEIIEINTLATKKQRYFPERPYDWLLQKAEATGCSKMVSLLKYLQDDILNTDTSTSETDGKLNVVSTSSEGIEDTLQRSSTTVKWSQWLLETTRKLSHLQDVWGVFEGIRTIDESVTLQNVLQAVLMAWEQPHQPLSRGLFLKIHTAQEQYMTQTEPLTKFTGRRRIPRSQSASNLHHTCPQQRQHSATKHDKHHSKSMKADGMHRFTDQDGHPHQSNGTRQKFVDGERIPFQRFKDTKQQSPRTVKWQQWLQDNTRKLLQLQAVRDILENLLAIGESVDLHSLLQPLLMAWEQPQQSSVKGLTIRIRTAHGSYMIQMEPLTKCTRQRRIIRSQSTSGLDGLENIQDTDTSTAKKKKENVSTSISIELPTEVATLRRYLQLAYTMLMKRLQQHISNTDTTTTKKDMKQDVASTPDQILQKQVNRRYFRSKLKELQTRLEKNIHDTDANTTEMDEEQNLTFTSNELLNIAFTTLDITLVLSLQNDMHDTNTNTTDTDEVQNLTRISNEFTKIEVLSGQCKPNTHKFMEAILQLQQIKEMFSNLDQTSKPDETIETPAVQDGFPEGSFEQALCDLMVETVFPICAIFLVGDRTESLNTASISALKSGKAYRGEHPPKDLNTNSWIFQAGSTAEGLTLQISWGHPWPDIDLMVLLGNYLGVNMPGHQHRNYRSIPSSSSAFILVSYHDKGCFEYAPDCCPPAFTKLRVRNILELKQREPQIDWFKYVEERGGNIWLNTCRSINVITQVKSIIRISGPAIQTLLNDMDADIVSTLVANTAHPAMADYLQRPRGEWPPRNQLDEIQQLPLCLVLVGSRESDNTDLEARASWSAGEVLLISKLPNIIKQGFIAAKFTMKSVIKIIREKKGIEPTDGRSHVGSYHIKTTLLHHLEKTPPSKINSPFCLMKDLLCDLKISLISGILPHYFLQECNLLTTIGREERQIALNAIDAIVSDPVATIIKCPSKPTEIYGDVCPEGLVSAFHRVAADPSCMKSRNDLLVLLSQLDTMRLYKYCQNLMHDEAKREGVPVRPDMTRLGDMLHKITHL